MSNPTEHLVKNKAKKISQTLQPKPRQTRVKPTHKNSTAEQEHQTNSSNQHGPP
jgi:hypothetical protein